MVWQTDHSPGFVLNGATLSLVNPHPTGVPSNAMWVQGSGMNSGEYYWIFSFTNLTDDTFVGITNQARFAPGFEQRCLCYGGNLSNGNNLLTLDFGPRITQGSTVGMLVSYTLPGRIRVYFDHNGVELGLAYEIPVSELPNARPTVQFGGTGTVTIHRQTAVPPSRTHTPPIYTGIAGAWKLLHLTNSTPNPTIPQPTLDLQHEAATNRYSGEAEIVNLIHYFLTQRSDSSWVATGGTSTLMAGPPEALALEQRIYDVLLHPTNIGIIRHDRLLYNSTAGETIWDRYDPAPGPFEGDPFGQQ